MKAFRIVLAGLWMLIALMILGCSRAGDSPKLLKVAFVTNNAADFWTIARKGCSASRPRPVHRRVASMSACVPIRAIASANVAMHHPRCSPTTAARSTGARRAIRADRSRSAATMGCAPRSCAKAKYVSPRARASTVSSAMPEPGRAFASGARRRPTLRWGANG